jgi:hypothetical protein
MTVMPMVPMMPVSYRPLAHVVALIEAEHAFGAAGHTANRGADHRADWTGDTVALIEAMSGAAGNALRLCGERHRKHREKCADNEQVLFMRLFPFEVGGFFVGVTVRNWHDCEAIRRRNRSLELLELSI